MGGQTCELRKGRRPGGHSRSRGGEEPSRVCGCRTRTKGHPTQAGLRYPLHSLASVSPTQTAPPSPALPVRMDSFDGALLCVPAVPIASCDPGLPFTLFSSEETELAAQGHAAKGGQVGELGVQSSPPGGILWSPRIPWAISPSSFLEARAGRLPWTEPLPTPG